MKNRKFKFTCYLLAAGCYISIAIVSFITGRYLEGALETVLGLVHIMLGASYLIDHEKHTDITPNNHCGQEETCSFCSGCSLSLKESNASV